jgi:hypothetical protein
MHEDPLGLHLALHDRPALPGIDAEPATRRRRALVLDADRRFGDVARAVAQLQIGGCRHCQHR